MAAEPEDLLEALRVSVENARRPKLPPRPSAADVEDALAFSDTLPAVSRTRQLAAEVLHLRAELGMERGVRSAAVDDAEAMSARVAELEQAAAAGVEFVRAVDQARAATVPPMLGPVLAPFQLLRKATNVGPFLGEEHGVDIVGGEW